MTSETPDSDKVGASFRRAAKAIPAVCVAVGLALAATIQIECFDGFQVLNNARAIADGNNSGYSVLRHIGVPAILALPALAERLTGIDGLLFVGAHLLGVCFYALSILAMHGLLRQVVGKDMALLGALLLATNPFWFHISMAVKEDLPGACLCLFGFWFYLEHRESRSHRGFIAACVCLGLAALFRHDAGPPLMLAVGIDQVVAFVHLRRTRQGHWTFLLARGLIALAVPAAVVLLTPCIVYPLLGRGSSATAPLRFLCDVYVCFTSAMSLPVERQSPWLCARLLWSAFGWQLPVAAAGCAWLFSRRVRSAPFLALWPILVLGWRMGLSVTYETRYLLPLFGAIVTLCAAGLEWMLGRIRRPALARALAWGVLALSTIAWLREVKRHCDPVYFVPYQKNVSRAARDLADGRRLFWVGPYYPLHPRDYIFHPQDRFAYIYHFYAHVVRFYAEQPVRTLPPVETLADGDVIICNPEPLPYETGNLPARLNPLELLRVERHDFQGHDMLTSSRLPDARIETRANGHGGGALVGRGFCEASAYFLITRQAGSEPPRLLGQVITAAGEFEFEFAHGNDSGQPFLGPDTVLSLMRVVPRGSFPPPE